MKTSNSSNRLSLAVACALALAAASGAVSAQNLTPNEARDTWSENSRTQIWLNAYGECWRNMYGPPPGYGECNPAPIARVTPPAPVVVIPAPAPVQYVAPAPAPVIEPTPLPPRKTRG